MNLLFDFSKRHVRLLLSIIVLLTLQSIGTLLIPFLTASMIDNGILNSDMTVISKVGVQMLITALLATLVAIAGSYFSADFAARFGKDLREKLFCKTQDLSISDFDKFGTSSILTRTTTDITVIQKTIMTILQLMIPAPLILITAVVLTAQENAVLALVIVGFIIVFLISTVIILKKSSSLSEHIQIRMDAINRVVRESIVGVRVIRAFNRSCFEKERSDEACSEYADTMISINKLFAVLNSFVWLLMGIIMAAVIWIGGASVLTGSMEVGGIVSITEYATIAMSYLIMAVTSIVMIPKMRNCLERIDEVLGTEASIQDTVTFALPSSDKAISPSVVFNDVGFSYSGAEGNVLSHLSFSCDAGKTTAIIGSTGSGKSSIGKILLRLHDINSGQIRIDGKNIQEYSQHDLRERIAYVPQKAFLFSGSIADNLAMGKQDASTEEMWHALNITQAESFVESLPDKLQSHVAQGGNNFSGGQKQRLAIARALIKETGIYLFDDSFSALDFKTDAALRKALHDNIHNSVVIIIAQRISTIVDADQIIVLDEGEIVGIGQHNDLLKTCPIYHEIAKSQLDMEA